MPERVFGHIPGYPEGSCFATRAAVAEAGLHRPPVAGIAGSGRLGATSVVIAGGYEDTQDFGDVIIYTGHGGRDPETGYQHTDQTLTRGNLALVYNKIHALPVRVIRGARHPSPYAPVAGYRYDGLYLVEHYWREIGKSGFYIWRFRLRKILSLHMDCQLLKQARHTDEDEELFMNIAVNLPVKPMHTKCNKG
jgi:putative restriction endonuclease